MCKFDYHQFSYSSLLLYPLPLDSMVTFSSISFLESTSFMFDHQFSGIAGECWQRHYCQRCLWASILVRTTYGAGLFILPFRHGDGRPLSGRRPNPHPLAGTAQYHTRCIHHFWAVRVKHELVVIFCRGSCYQTLSYLSCRLNPNLSPS